jgi:hypothetical protein
VRIHRDYVERRIGGGAPPTTEAYARALEQFQRIPGAVRVPAAETTPDLVRRRAGAEAEEAEEAVDAEEAAPAAEEAAEPGTGGAWEPEP